MKKSQNITVKLGEFVENPDNPSVASDEDIARLAGKLKRVPLGLTAMRIAYVADAIEGKRMVISGNKRLRVLKQAYGENGEVPSEWFADVTAMSEAERHEFIVTANVSDGEWDVDKLLAQYDKSELGELMPSEDLEKLLDGIEGAEVEGETDADAVPEVPEEPKSKRGAVYQLGRHRVMCGDSTKAEDVARLMGGELADLVVTDPPYNVNYVDGSEEKRVNSKHWVGYKKHKPIAGDNFDTDEEFAEKLLRPAMKNLFDFSNDCCAYYMSMPQGGTHMMMMMMMMREVGWQVKHEMIWVKNQPVLSRADYNYQHEPISYGWKKTHKFYGGGDFHTTSVWPFDRPRRSDDHPTMKPVALWVNMVKNSSADGDVVLDLFGGSGTTVLACEQTGRMARVMEFETCYVDVIRRRWAEFVHGEGCDWENLTPEITNESKKENA